MNKIALILIAMLCIQQTQPLQLGSVPTRYITPIAVAVGSVAALTTTAWSAFQDSSVAELAETTLGKIVAQICNPVKYPVAFKRLYLVAKASGIGALFWFIGGTVTSILSPFGALRYAEAVSKSIDSDIMMKSSFFCFTIRREWGRSKSAIVTEAANTIKNIEYNTEKAGRALQYISNGIAATVDICESELLWDLHKQKQILTSQLSEMQEMKETIEGLIA